MSFNTRPQTFSTITTQKLNVVTHADVENIRISGNIRVNKDPTKHGHFLSVKKDGSTEWKEVDTQPFFTNKQSKYKDDPNICYNKGSVGVGVRQPRNLLHVGNDMRVDGIAKVEVVEFLTSNTTLNKNQTFNICTKKENVLQISDKNNIGICYETPGREACCKWKYQNDGSSRSQHKPICIPQTIGCSSRGTPISNTTKQTNT